jgi:hypothetical protein
MFTCRHNSSVVGYFSIFSSPSFIARRTAALCSKRQATRLHPSTPPVTLRDAELLVTLLSMAPFPRRGRTGQPKRLDIEASSGSSDAAGEVRSGLAEHSRIDVVRVLLMRWAGLIGRAHGSAGLASRAYSTSSISLGRQVLSKKDGNGL